MSTTKVGKDTSLTEGGVFFQTYRDLLKQREALDRQILRMQGRFLRLVERKTSSRGGKKKYVARMENTTILRDAIRDSMVIGKKITMPKILKILEGKELYHTKSSYFYTMVNNKLNRDPLVKKVSRGVFVLKRRAGQRRKAS